jgi:ATP synthase F1 complex assembly factor 2
MKIIKVHVFSIFETHVYLNIFFHIGWYEINLDQRKLRTPGGNLFRVPNEELAFAVATEWNGQKKVVQRHSMHLVTFDLLLSNQTHC